MKLWTLWLIERLLHSIRRSKCLLVVNGGGVLLLLQRRILRGRWNAKRVRETPLWL